MWHEKALEDSLLTNDCIGHAVNYGVRGPLFTNREQLQRLASIRGKKKKSHIDENKLKGGLSVHIFKDFLIQGNTSYSLKHVKNFSLAKKEGNAALKDYIERKMLVEKPKYHQLIFIGSA